MKNAKKRMNMKLNVISSECVLMKYNLHLYLSYSYRSSSVGWTTSIVAYLFIVVPPVLVCEGTCISGWGLLMQDGSRIFLGDLEVRATLPCRSITLF